MIREDEKNGVLFFDYNMARGEFEKKLYNMFVKEDYSLDTIISWAISYGELHNHWISVEDELPPKNEAYLAFWQHLGVTKYRYVKAGAKVSRTFSEHITHWMPLPSIEHLKEK